MPSLHQLPAPAKLNLFLHVTSRRADGYHELQSVFVLLDWHDTIDLDTREDGQLLRHDLSAQLPADDLCLRAARLLQRESGTPWGCDIRIHKRLPWGAGLGGGSSDAATVLVALNQLWGLHWPVGRLEKLALQLGADVPFFVRGRPAWVEGVGEHITPIALPADLLRTPLALLKPPAAIPTAAIFGSALLKRDTPRATLAAFLAEPKRFGHNDLQEPAQAWCAPTPHTSHTSHTGDEAGTAKVAGDGSDVTHALGVMQTRFGNSRMTGSGSTVFSWVDGNNPLDDALNADDVTSLAGAGAHGAHWVGRVCRVLPQHPLLNLLTRQRA
jgi:4-diphosphocytidyl-2-C-methyl-D-erythritol kinase